MVITINQMDAARALLNLSQSDIAEGVGVSNSTMTDSFRGKTEIKIGRMADIVSFLESKGAVFEKGGVFINKPDIQTFTGQVGFWAFYDDVYETIKSGASHILVNNVEESLFLKWLGNKKKSHDARMEEIEDYKVRILIKEGDQNFAAEYGKVEYRWTPKDKFSNIPFYIYGYKTAIIEFQDDDVFISVISSEAITRAFKKSFFESWEQSIIAERD